MSFGEFRPTPRLPASSGERRWAAVIIALLAGLFAAEIVTNFTTEKLSIVFVALFWGPALILHELGHAWTARLLGWHVGEIVIGFGRELLTFRVGETRVRVKMLPVEGYVVPNPTSLRYARLKSALIYAAGPGAELLLILGLWLWLGSELFEPSRDVGVIAAQSAALAAAVGAGFNLLPFPTQGGVSDGLGVILSLVSSPDSFKGRLLLPFISEARRSLYREEPDAAAAAIRQGQERDATNGQLQGLSAVLMAMRSETEAAFDYLESLGHPDDRPSSERAELLLAAAWVTLLSGERHLYAQAESACQRVLSAHAGDSRALLLLGRIELERGLPENAYRVLMEGYAASRETEEEAQFSAYLAIACARGERTEYAQRFAAQLANAPVGPALRARVQSEVS